MEKIESVKIKFRGDEVEIPKCELEWFKEKIKADEESAKALKKDNK